MNLQMPWNGKVRGTYDTVRRTYVRSVRPAHFAIKHNGWGVQKEILDELMRIGCLWVEVRYTVWTDERYASVVKYRAPMAAFLQHGVTDTLNIVDGTQVFLSKQHFRVGDSDLPEVSNRNLLNAKCEACGTLVRAVPRASGAVWVARKFGDPNGIQADLYEDPKAKRQHKPHGRRIAYWLPGDGKDVKGFGPVGRVPRRETC